MLGHSVATAALMVTAGCAGHASRTEGARTALDEGRPRRALELLDDELDVSTARALPAKVGGDNALLLLDRALVLQAIASRTSSSKDYALSSRDLEIADKQIEVLDLSRNASADLGKYLFSDDTGPYKAPTYEKLMINTMNMVNYLARGDLNGAKVEARRFAVMQRYIDEHEGHGASLCGPGSYLAGFAFEESGDAGEALRYYDEALQYGDYASLGDPVRRLALRSSYRTPRLSALIGDAKPEAGASGDAKPEAGASDDDGDVLLIVEFGRVPAKVAVRLPIGLALTYVSGAISPNDAARANYLAAQGLVSWVNYPRLGRTHGAYDEPSAGLDRAGLRLEGLLAVDEEAKKAWEEAKGTLILSAITRLIARATTGEVVRRASGDSLFGELLSLGTQATLTALDTPDTRSWATLPARIALARIRVTPGKHVLDVEVRGVHKEQPIDVPPRGFSVVNLTVLR